MVLKAHEDATAQDGRTLDRAALVLRRLRMQAQALEVVEVDVLGEDGASHDRGLGRMEDRLWGLRVKMRMRLRVWFR